MTAKSRQLSKLRRFLRYADLLVFVRPVFVLFATGWLAYEISGRANDLSGVLYGIFIPFAVAFVWLVGYAFTAVRRKSTLRALIIVRSWLR